MVNAYVSIPDILASGKVLYLWYTSAKISHLAQALEIPTLAIHDSENG